MWYYSYYDFDIWTCLTEVTLQFLISLVGGENTLLIYINVTEPGISAVFTLNLFFNALQKCHIFLLNNCL